MPNTAIFTGLDDNCPITKYTHTGLNQLHAYIDTHKPTNPHTHTLTLQTKHSGCQRELRAEM